MKKLRKKKKIKTENPQTESIKSMKQGAGASWLFVVL